jgi:putative ubiquitin-RnfH superfamily antitoxin RatB of RatAB toxin-antitoxin module
MPNSINVEIAYAKPDNQLIIALTINAGATIAEAINNSDILSQCPELDLARIDVGIFSTLQSLDYVLQDGDRIEIYRPLFDDPKEIRRRRAEITPVGIAKKWRAKVID